MLFRLHSYAYKCVHALCICGITTLVYVMMIQVQCGQAQKYGSLGLVCSFVSTPIWNYSAATCVYKG